MAHTHIKKTPALGGVAIGYKTTPEAFREALNVAESATTEIEDMTDDQIRELAAADQLHIATTVDALRRSGRGELALELDAAYGAKPEVGEMSEGSEPEVESEDSVAVGADDVEPEDDGFVELSDVEPSGSGSADESEESVDAAPVAPDSSDSEDSEDSDGVLVQKLAGGWYELEDGSKVRKADLPDGAVIIAED